MKSKKDDLLLLEQFKTKEDILFEEAKFVIDLLIMDINNEYIILIVFLYILKY